MDFLFFSEGVNSTVSVSVTGSSSATVTQVDLVDSSGSRLIEGSVEPQGDGDFLVRFDRIPSVEFGLRVRGRVNNSSSRVSDVLFERHSSTTIKSSTLTVTVS